MRKLRLSAYALMILAVPLLAGCGHQLTAPKGQDFVIVFPDQATLKKVRQMQKESGLAGVFGSLGEAIVATHVDDKTPIKIISRDADAVEIQVLDGPHKGLKGFVAKENVD